MVTPKRKHFVTGLGCLLSTLSLPYVIFKRQMIIPYFGVGRGWHNGSNIHSYSWILFSGMVDAIPRDDGRIAFMTWCSFPVMVFSVRVLHVRCLSLGFSNINYLLSYFSTLITYGWFGLFIHVFRTVCSPELPVWPTNKSDWPIELLFGQCIWQKRPIEQIVRLVRWQDKEHGRYNIIRVIALYFMDSVFWKCSESDLLRYVTLSFFHSGFMRGDSDERCLLLVNFSISDSFKFTTQSVYSPTVLLVWQVTDRRANRSGHACWMGGKP